MLRTPRRAGAVGGLAAVVLALVTPLALAPTAHATTSGAAATRPHPSSSTDSLWTASAAKPRASLDGHRQRVDPSAYRGYTLDGSGMASLLGRAPSEQSGAQGTLVSLPSPDGTFVDFRVVDSPVMQAGLAARHPEISTYAGRSTDGTATVRLDMTPMGFHAFVRGDQGGDAWMVDPAYDGDDSLYLSYLTSDVPAPAGGLKEREAPLTDGDADAATTGDPGDQADPGGDGLAKGDAGELPGAAVVQRTYRLALMTDPSYATYFGTQNVLAEKVTLMNRVDEIYTNDLAIKMVLINDEDKLNLDTDAKAYGANGPCGPVACFTTAQVSNGCASSLLSANRIALGQIVGADSYDIGHIGLGINGGGIASLGVVGGNNKGQGCTGLPEPEGDFYAVDYVAHEMGHEYAGNHTFNGTQYNCASGNRNGSTSVEPGSGSSVMAYAGICQQDNLQPHSDPYFSERSQSEITTYVTRTLANVNESQTVGLGGFTTSGQTFTLNVTGLDGVVHTTAPIYEDATVPADAPTGSQPYTTAGLKAAIENALGGSAVTITAYGTTSTRTALSTNGFTVTFTVAPYAGVDLAPITLTPGAPSITAQVGTTAQGGPATNGGTSTVTDNHVPVVTPADARTIPVQTPFTLTGSATDADGDPLVYLWEQNDIGPNDTRSGSVTTPGGTGLVQQPKLNGPLFRVFGTYANVTPAGTLVQHSPGENLAGSDPSRTFPDMQQILDNNTNAETGTCPTAPAAPATGGATNVPVSTIDCFSEFLPTPDYVGYAGSGNASPPSLDFRLTARDQDPLAGGYSFGDTKLTLDPGAGPFLVTTKSTANPTAAVAGRSEAIAWNVANTDGYTDTSGTVHQPLATDVKISLSTDGGHTFPYVLAADTANDGSQVVTWPNVSTDHARIKIEAVGNYFFDVNNDDFSIVPRLVTTGPDDGSSYAAQYSDPLTSAPTYTAESGSVSSGDDLTATADGLPAGLSLDKTQSSAAGTTPATATWTVTGDVADEPGTYPVTVTISDGVNADVTKTFQVVVTPEDATVAYTGPATAQAAQGGDVTVTALVTPSADGTPGDLTTATVTFTNARADDEVLCADAPVSATGVATCTFAADFGDGDSRSYSVDETVGGDYAGASTQTGALTVSMTTTTPPPTTPDTTITAGPADGSVLVATSTTVRFTSTVAGSTFGCALDGASVPCTTSATLTGLKPGTHTFAVAASAGDQTDPTPASTTFTVPVDDASLGRTGNDWKELKVGSAYQSTLSSTQKAKATLTYRVTKATGLSLVVPRAAGFGTVQVYLGGKLIRTVGEGNAPAGPRQVVTVYRGAAFSGVVKLVHTGAKTVRVDGLAVVTG